MGIFINLSVFTLFIIIAIILSMGKGSSLIAGYNTLPKEEKKKYDGVALSKFMGKIMYGISFSILLLYASEIFEMDLLLGIGIAVMIVLPIFAVIYVNTGNRFKNE